MISIRHAETAADVKEAAYALYPVIEAGQVGFGLSGQGSPEALTRAWVALLEHPKDFVLVALDGAKIVGACGILVSDDLHLQAVNGPVAIHEPTAVFDAMTDHLATDFPRAELLVGISHRHAFGLDWARSRGELIEHSWPYVGTCSDEVSQGRVVLVDEQERFAEVYDRAVGTELWWTSARIGQEWDQWICVVDETWHHPLAARVTEADHSTEVFGLSRSASVATTHSLLARWQSAARARGVTRAIFFAETPTQRAAADALRMTCLDEYLAWRISLGC